MLLGLTGKREAGKTTIANLLVKEHGFKKLHSAAPMKAAVRGYYEHLGLSHSLALSLTEGDLKDKPFNQIITTVVKPFREISPFEIDDWTFHYYLSELIPGYNSREVMEKFGKLMGVDMGVEWTLGAELKKQQRLHGSEANFVVESLVYETEFFKQLGGVVVQVIRPKHVGPIGLHTDEAVDAIVADDIFCNDMSIEELPLALRIWFSQLRKRMAR